MSVEQARALSISDNHDEQEKAWFDSPSYNRDPRTLRALLTSEHVRSTDRLARFVELEVYEAAGGTVLRDLFNADTSTFLTDQPLLTKLAMGTLEQAVEPLKAEGWAWVQTSLDASIMYGGGFGRIYPHTRELTEDEQAELSALGERFDEMQAGIEAFDEGDPAVEAEEQRLVEIEQRIAVIQNVTKSYDPQEQAVFRRGILALTQFWW
ncbi:hypothetical protein [Agrobacterium tumefaciens]|uniref:hypothetical protein n=1 Tax=Agrobacterium tumefaciens TaxID=358 RepID=UPI002FD9C993